jgi:myo-inositol-1(or 4)-monophosphatase
VIDDHELDELLGAAEAAARTGGMLVAESYGASSAPREKAPGDWVSDVDVASEATIRGVLEQLAPGVAFFGEESGGDVERVGWLVDPLDGTSNFLHRFPAVGVSIALVEEGAPVVGVVHAPLLAETYTARRGGGTARDGEPLRISTRLPDQAICATGFPFRAKADRLPSYFPVFEAALREFEDLRRAGSASLDLAWTASGTFDGYFEQALGPWDVAAGGLLVREAGGVVTDWEGDDHAWISSGDIVAGPPAIHERLLRLTKGAQS